MEQQESKRSYPCVYITSEMLTAAQALIHLVQVSRTVTSPFDTLAGILGEYAFAQYFFGDWKKNNVGITKGKTDFNNIEIKTSAFPFSEKLNLLVREDYALKRKPPFYVQVILDISSKHATTIDAGTKAIFCGYATHEDVAKANIKDFGSKLSAKGNYRCYYIPVSELKRIETLKTAYTK